MASTPSRLDAVINLAKRRGFVFPCGEIYGGTRSAWDYGPLGVELKENIKRQWWQYMVRSRDDVVGLDSSVILPRETWVASGHVGAFTDPLVESLHTHKRYRADQLIEDYAARKGLDPENVTLDMVPDPVTGQPGSWTVPREFSGLLKTYLGPVDDESGLHYLRPETAQGIFINFANVMSAARKKPPFGIGQVGKSFRNEITPGNFIFRTREFEQMELEFFCEPDTDLEWFDYWRSFCHEWLKGLNMHDENLRLRDHEKEELSFYSKATTDFEYLFPFGWGELWGVADRTNYDLTQHQKFSGQDMDYFDQEKNEHYIPYVIEPSLGADRVTLAFLCEAYDEEVVDEAKNDTRVVMHFHPALAPFKCAVLPLSKKLSEPATELYHKLQKRFMCDYDEAGSIGKRYRRQDEIGTPYCVTFDFDSAADGCVTVRDRDSMQQERIPMEQLEDYIAARIRF